MEDKENRDAGIDFVKFFSAGVVFGLHVHLQARPYTRGFSSSSPTDVISDSDHIFDIRLSLKSFR